MIQPQSNEETKERYLEVLGPELGPVFDALRNEVIWLHAKWLEYHKLYGQSQRRIDLLNRHAGFFFFVIQDVMWEDIILHMARLTDPPRSAGKDTLTLRRLPMIVKAELTTKLTRLVDEAIVKTSFVREWRNRHLAHSDLELTLKKSLPLAGVSRNQVEAALAAFRDVLNLIGVAYLDEETGFEHFITQGGDVEGLVYSLRLAAQIDDERMERVRNRTFLADDFKSPPEA